MYEYVPVSCRSIRCAPDMVGNRLREIWVGFVTDFRVTSINRNCAYQHRMSYIPVRNRLMSLMRSNVARLTDRKYMTQLASKLQEDYETRQKIRIERRKLKAISIVPKLREIPAELLPKQIIWRRRECAPKFHVKAAKMCKQLPGLLLADDS